ncbi:MAG TPA: recombinase [Porticoccaceae bacterium]|nr:recombinase [Porticoccaceae bacterium]
MKSRTPSVQEKKWMSAMAEFGCVICKKLYGVTSPAEIHHIEGKTKPDAHLLTIPLCYAHHRAGEDNEKFTSRHPSKSRFIARYGTEYDLREYIADKINWTE